MRLEAAPLPGRWCCGGAPRAGRWPPGYSGLCRAGPPGGNGGCGRLAAAGRARGSGHCWEWGQGQCARLCVSWGGRPLHLHRYVLWRARGRGREKGRGRGGERGGEREGGGEEEMERLREAEKQEDGRRRALEGEPTSGKLLRFVQVPRPPPNTHPSEKHGRGPGRPGLGSGGWAGVRQRGQGLPGSVTPPRTCSPASGCPVPWHLSLPPFHTGSCRACDASWEMGDGMCMRGGLRH